MTWLRRYRWTVLDAGVVAVLAVPVGLELRYADPAIAILALLQIAPLPLRRRVPVAVALVTALAGLGLAALDHPVLPAALVPVLALYTLAATARWRTSLATLAGTVVVTGAAVLRAPHASPIYLLANTLALATAWAVGTHVRERMRRLASDRAEGEHRAAAAERQRIARELHDVVTHNVTVMVITAGAGRIAADADPVRLRGELETVEKLGRQTLVELRRLLGVLRADGAPALTPAPGLGQLDALVDDTRRAGLPVELVVRGKPRPLPQGVDGSAYRIVQEALANALRHAGPCTATVDVRYADEELHLAIVDDGWAAAGSAGGHGIVGMRERVAMLGGQLDVGPRAEGGFAVRVRLPLGAR